MSHWYLEPPREPSSEHYQAALAHSLSLTKPPGSLGRLEQLAAQIAAIQCRDRPGAERIVITVFAADHGVADEGVSAFPQAVTAEMVKNFASGGAAISVLARQLMAQFHVVNMGTVAALAPLPQVIDCRVAAGTDNFCRAPAMSAAQLEQALAAGAAHIDQHWPFDCFIGGEMGIANTTAAAAIAAALLGMPVTRLVGRGTGLDDDGVRHKAAVIERALQFHGDQLASPLAILQRLGGFEIAALTAAYIRAAQCGAPVLVDGFICSVAALVAVRLNPGVRPYLIFAHQSEESGHRHVLDAMAAKPLLDLGLRLGEGSGAALAAPLLRMACATHNDMASFASAGVSQSERELRS